MTILTIDFEASCLPRHGLSYPIEVGIACDGKARSWLIRPHDDWAGWYWSDEAEALHGLSLDQVNREGLPAETVLAELAAACDGRRMVADSMIDQYWLDTLADAAGQPTPFLIDHVSFLLDEHRADEQRIGAAVAYADARHAERHRAASDALWLSALLDHISARPVVEHRALMRLT
ncbi:hypothetical protein CAF53_03800 [Sphingobium sp. LB126]|uniref:3'-5' exonuclease n=1 Tax=Sphingobium sp. LB126 TaxID=1983755 RepID=UPI000C20F968|nr:hypothetical protein [Sphingobium sp. LB126]PJG47464.1 hypothetical protein CAF53_03800 [Sphingobium sp. LB126]